MTALRLMRADEMREKRDEMEAQYGAQWLETLVLLQAEQIARLTRKVSDLEGGVTP